MTAETLLRPELLHRGEEKTHETYHIHFVVLSAHRAFGGNCGNVSELFILELLPQEVTVSNTALTEPSTPLRTTKFLTILSFHFHQSGKNHGGKYVPFFTCGDEPSFILTFKGTVSNCHT